MRRKDWIDKLVALGKDVRELLAAEARRDPEKTDQEHAIECLELIRADMVKAGKDVREIDEILKVLAVDSAKGVEMADAFFKCQAAAVKARWPH